MADLPFDENRTDGPPPSLWSELGGLQDLIGSRFVDSNGESYGGSVLESKTVLGLYFSAHWSALNLMPTHAVVMCPRSDHAVTML